jgi:hypothetical protein
MPRRNANARPVPKPRFLYEEDDQPATYEQMARALVLDGRCSLSILDDPKRAETIMAGRVDA